VPTTSATIGDVAAVERGGYLRVRLHPVADASQLVLQALDDRGITVDASTLVQPGDGRGAQLAILTAPALREMLDRAVETLDSLAAVDEVAAVMDSAGAA
jgi:pantoate kinase